MRHAKPLASWRTGIVLALGLLVLSLASPPARAQAAEAPPPAQPVHHDPLEGLNRGLYRIGQALDHAIVQPIVSGYRRIAPRPVRRAVHNVIQNLDEPVVFANDLLQLHPKDAAKTAVRFVANSTVGVAGIFDAASTAGLPHRDNGFGTTLGHYGVPPGPYFYVPLLGPTTLRDVVGDGVDIVADPLTWTQFHGVQTVEVARTSLDLLDTREQADEDLRRLRATAADPYATLRSVYLQSRQAEIRREEVPLEPLPEIPEPPPAEPEASPTPPAAPTP